jgi:hypothetical protein
MKRKEHSLQSNNIQIAFSAAMGSPLPGLWVPVLALAHVFAGFWLCRTYLVGLLVASNFKRKNAFRKPVFNVNGGQLASTYAAQYTEDQSSCAQQCQPSDTPGEPIAAYARTTANTENDSCRNSLSFVAGPGCNAHSSTVDSRAEDACVGFEPPALVSSTVVGSGVHALDVESMPVTSKQNLAGCGLQMTSAYVHNSLITVSTSTKSTLKEMLWKRGGCSYKAHGSGRVVLQDVWGSALSGEVQVGLPPVRPSCVRMLSMMRVYRNSGRIVFTQRWHAECCLTQVNV